MFSVCFCFFILFSFLRFLSFCIFCLCIFLFVPPPPSCVRAQVSSIYLLVVPRGTIFTPSDQPPRVSLCSLFASFSFFLFFLPYHLCTCWVLHLRTSWVLHLNACTCFFVPLCLSAPYLYYVAVVDVQICLMCCVYVRGRGRYGYKVRRAGGGIGAGFPLVTFRSMSSPRPYLFCVKRYSHRRHTYPHPSDAIHTTIHWSGARHECHDLLFTCTCALCQANAKCFSWRTSNQLVPYVCVIVVVCECAPHSKLLVLALSLPECEWFISR